MRWLFVVVLTLGGCATPYREIGPAGLGGGVEALQTSADGYRIEVRVSQFTSRALIDDYMMLRSAEVAKARGCPRFLIVTSNYEVLGGADFNIMILCKKQPGGWPDSSVVAEEIIEATGPRLKGYGQAKPL